MKKTNKKTNDEEPSPRGSQCPPQESVDLSGCSTLSGTKDTDTQNPSTVAGVIRLRQRLQPQPDFDISMVHTSKCRVGSTPTLAAKQNKIMTTTFETVMDIEGVEDVAVEVKASAYREDDGIEVEIEKIVLTEEVHEVIDERTMVYMPKGLRIYPTESQERDLSEQTIEYITSDDR